jgi:hypothetical protein
MTRLTWFVMIRGTGWAQGAESPEHKAGSDTGGWKARMNDFDFPGVFWTITPACYD